MENAMQLAKHSKHTPKLLRHQVLCALMKMYVPTEEDRDNSDQPSAAPAQAAGNPADSCGPTIQRFHGALLFVDISGFTALSTKLDVETLKNHINSYFSKMLDIVEKWEGDVIKFAGDALFIVWPTVMDKQAGVSNNTSRSVSSNLSGHTQFAIAAKRSLEKAVACGLEISTVCGNYEVKLPSNESGSDSPSLMNKLLPNFSFFSGGAAKVVPAAPAASDSPQESVVFLNVHSGVSCGLMAGVDIIHGNRGEFFLVGDPLTGVAMAESQASKGDVVLDVAAHELLHGDNATAAVNRHLGAVDKSNKGGDNMDEGANEKKEEEEEIVVQLQGQIADGCLKCGCLKTASGLFCVSRLLTRISKDLDKKKTRGKMKADHAQVRSEWGLINMRQYEDIQYDIEKLYSSAQHSIKREFLTFLKSMHADEESLDWKTEEKKYGGFLKEQVKTHFLEWMERILGDVITQHVHEVARLAQRTTRKRLSSFVDLLQESKKVLERTRSDYAFMSSALTTTLDSGDSNAADVDLERATSPDISSPRDSDVLSSPAVMEERVKRDSIKTTSQHHKSSFSTELNNGEIRTVIVLFIKIEKFDLRLRIDAVGKPCTFAYNRFSFLDRTESEIEADEQLMRRFQACFSVLCKAFSDHGGQLRQFIVDDKGTVCIGTFGLRGSASVDNAAAALEAAKNVVIGLKSIGLGASIGITSGKGYCGLVGSSARHEYAVMGPSTNLSARLMCKAPAHGIICDADTVNRDRTHRFIQLAEIQAKGYTKPVTIFKPAAEHDSDVDISGRLAEAKKSVRGNAKNWNMSHVGLKRAAEEANGVLSATNLASMTALQRMMEVSKTDFYITETKTNFEAHDHQKSALTQKLHGRKEHIMAIFAFLFDNDAADCQSLSFKVKVKMAVVCAASGLGKTAMLNAIERKLVHISRTDAKCNLLILRNRASSLHSDVPFFGVRSVLQNLLMIINRTVRRGEEAGDNRGFNRIVANINAKDFQPLLLSMIAHPEDPNSSVLVTCLLSDTYMTEAQAEDMSIATINYVLRSVSQFVSMASKDLKKLLLFIM
ncbi:adenylate/guanylate cyclase domain-containing protein [archaeon]|nr:MAG: adenylate/guanylate cyclase domain-containing protein [archaeon]